MSITSKIANAIELSAASAKSIAKMMLTSRRVRRPEAHSRTESIIILANGPSLRDTIDSHSDILARYPLMAVNFAATAPGFMALRPEYYILADPHFFELPPSANVERLTKAFAAVDWPMTLFIPAGREADARRLTEGNAMVRFATFNPVGVEGFAAVENMAFARGWGMPRPRNVLIPALMMAIELGFGKVYVAGADHSWMKTLEVTDDNIVVSVQPHFYKDAGDETARITSMYRDIRLHEVVRSFYVAFRSYHTIERYARRRGVEIINVTPGSFIDAFRRGSLEDIEQGGER